MRMFKLVLVVVFTLVLVVSNLAQAQQTQPAPVNSWVVGTDLAPASWVKADGMLQPFGNIRSASGDKPLADQEKDVLATVFVGYKPLNWFGGEVRFQKFGTHGQLDGSVGQTRGMLMVWGADATPKIISTAPVLNGLVAYNLKSSTKLSRIDILGNYSFALTRGWVSAFAGVPILKMESTEDVARSQGFLLYARLPNGTLDTKGVREDYIFSSMAASKATIFGIAGGVEGEYCLVSDLVLEGRIGLAVFPWGSTKLGGQFSATKDVYLVNVADGVSATPIQTLAHLNLANILYVESAKETVTAVEAKLGFKWRVKVGERASLNLGMAISRSSLSNVPIVAGYVVGDPYAVGNGKFSPRTANILMWAPTLTVGLWF